MSRGTRAGAAGFLIDSPALFNEVHMTSARLPRLLFFNGRNVPYHDARVHALSTAFKYPATVFEGLRARHDGFSHWLIPVY